MDSLLNADIALDTIKNTAAQYNLEVSPKLTAPWEAASIEAGNYKKWLQDNIPNGVLAGVTDENGVITLFSKNLDKKINGPWSKAKTAVKNYVTYMGSKTVKNLPSMFTTWQSKIQGIANKWNNVKKAAKEAAQAQINAAKVKVPKNQGSPRPGGRPGGGKPGGGPGGGKPGGRPGGGRPGGRPGGGKTSPKKYTGMVEAGVTWNNKYYTTIARTKQKYDTKQKAISAAVEVAHSQLLQKLSGAFPNSAEANRVYQQQIRKKVAIRRSTAYAKGTLGTKKDEWAIDSEPQQGDELVLVPGKGVLSYMRKGTSVIPADLTKNLMEWGKLSPNEHGVSENVNIVNNYISGSESKVDLGTNELSQGNISETAKNNSRNTEDVNKSVEDSNQSIKDTTDDTNKHIEKSVNDTANNTINELNLVLDSTKNIDQSIVKDTGNTLDSILNSTKDTNKDVVKNSNDTLNSVLDSTKDTNQDTIDDSENTLKSILSLTNSYKPSITTNLTSPWIDTSKKSEDFKSKANTSYREVMSYVNQNKGNLESYLKTPYVNLTGKKDTNAVYRYSNYAKKAAITNIITYAKSKSKSVTSSLSKGYNDARQSISNFSSAGCASVDRLKSKFTDSKNGLIKALKDTKQAAELAKKAIESVPSYGGSGGIGGLVVPSGGLSSPYGYRTDPKTGKVKFHGGNDYGAPYGARINAARSGIVSTVGWMPRGYGKYVILDHGNGIQTLYGHTSAILVKEGQRVTIGQQIAKVGSTGYSTGPHVHFEYRRNGKRLNPATLPRFAKGTMETKKDLMALTDEIGDELVMVPTAQGNISYMRKGTSVMPADISENLVEWGQLNPNMMNMPSATQGINLMSNYISKPELNLSFDSLVHVDNCSQDTLKDLEKMVDSKINTFSRQLNYSLKRFSK